MRVAQVVGKLAAGGVEAVVNTYYRRLDHTRIQFDYFIDEDSPCEPPEKLIALGARYYRIPPTARPIARVLALRRLFAQNCYPIVHAHMTTLNLPVLLADAEAGVIGVAHCGRRGLQQGVIGETVRMMTGKGASVERMVATLGPCICGDCYEVGESIAAEFDARFPGTATTTRFGGPGIDIAAAALQELAAAGITDDRIVESRPRVAAATQYLSEDDELAALCRTDGEGEPELAARIDGVRHSLCTLENPLWYSHRRAALADKSGEGRMLALIVRE